MVGISIFAKRAFLNINSSQEFDPGINKHPDRGHLLRVSSMIRGDQIADYLGAKLNPEYYQEFQDDICIYVKPHVHADDDFKFEGKKSYLDIVDGWDLITLIEKHPEVGVIACSAQDVEILSKRIPNEIELIPQHHCNYDRVKRNRNGISTVGIIGTKNAFKFIPNELKEGLKDRGIELLEYSKFFTRQDIIDFYMNIDLQLVWRPYRMRLSNPLKIVNASSFGIPTIALDESVFKEVMDCYIPVKSVDEFLTNLDILLESETAYDNYSKACLKRAENYHISKIAELYKKL